MRRRFARGGDCDCDCVPRSLLLSALDGVGIAAVVITTDRKQNALSLVDLRVQRRDEVISYLKSGSRIPWRALMSPYPVYMIREPG
jgi:hypothetical protein